MNVVSIGAFVGIFFFPNCLFHKYIKMNLLLPEVIGLASSTQRNRNAHWQNFLRFYINICNFEYPIPKFSVEFKVLEMYASFLIYILHFQAANNYISTIYIKLRNMEAFSLRRLPRGFFWTWLSSCSLTCF